MLARSPDCALFKVHLLHQIFSLPHFQQLHTSHYQLHTNFILNFPHYTNSTLHVPFPHTTTYQYVLFLLYHTQHHFLKYYYHYKRILKTLQHTKYRHNSILIPPPKLKTHYFPTAVILRKLCKHACTACAISQHTIHGSWPYSTMFFIFN